MELFEEQVDAGSGVWEGDGEGAGFGGVGLDGLVVCRGD
jgi:hypothetical protein